MIDFEHLSDIVQPTDSRIVMLVVDGLGGLPHPDTGRSELETARTPNLDRLAEHSSCGLTVPVLPGVTPGSGPGHLALFGYDPIKYLMGRGVLEALGIGIDLKEGEVAARGNFCTLDASGAISDRRAGRIPTEESAPLCEKLDRITVDDADLSVYPVKDHRFVLVLRGEGLSEQVAETDPQRSGVPPQEARALEPAAEKTARAINQFAAAARDVLHAEPKANMALLRGFSQLPHLPSMGQAYQLNPAAIAAYPMYRGLASVVGMQVIPTGSTFADEAETLRQHWRDHDFFYIHYKPADAAGEDGDFDAKVKALEDLDAVVPRIVEMAPDALVVAGDHSTPALLAAHSWHPVPVLIRSPWTEGTGSRQLSERECAVGALGTFPAQHLMLLALAHAGKLTKYGP